MQFPDFSIIFAQVHDEAQQGTFRLVADLGRQLVWVLRKLKIRIDSQTVFIQFQEALVEIHQSYLSLCVIARLGESQSWFKNFY
jgi:hypothetical protein